MDALLSLLVPDNFMPHGHCYLWTPVLLWMYVVSDTVIAISYYTIPMALLYLVKNARTWSLTGYFSCFPCLSLPVEQRI